MSAALQTVPSGPRSIRVRAKASDAAALPHVVLAEPASPPAPGPGQALVGVRAAGVNPSDVKAVLGAMPHAVWPRTPGRDYAGVVVDGPAEWIGKEVWGSGGDLGIRRDGTHVTRFAQAPAYQAPGHTDMQIVRLT